MKFFLVKNASKFAWEQLRENTDGWFMLSLKAFLIVLLMTLGLITCTIFSGFLYGFMAITPHFILYDPAWYIQVLVLLFFIVCIYHVVLHIVSFNNVPVANALDAAYGRPLRKFNNRVQVRSLFFVPLLQGLIITCGLLFLVIPGIYFAVRFSLACNVVLDEQCGSVQALRRSWDLTKNAFSIMFPVCAWTVLLLAFPITRFLNIFFPFVDLLMSHVYVFLKQK